MDTTLASSGILVSVFRNNLALDAPIGLCFLNRGLRSVRITRHPVEINGISAEAHWTQCSFQGGVSDQDDVIAAADHNFIRPCRWFLPEGNAR